MKKAHFSILLAAFGTLAFLPINQLAAPKFQMTVFESPAINRIATAQLFMLVLAAVVLWIVRRLFPEGFQKYWRPGDWAAPAQGVPWLGIKENESWRSVGTGFATAITLVTGLFMWFGFYQKMAVDWFGLLPYVLFFALTNSFSEEMMTRFTLAAGLEGKASKTEICLWNAAIFGGVHFFGTPGGFSGVMMAGFLGALLAKSVVETRGFGWAWFIHFLQDVVILFALLSAGPGSN